MANRREDATTAAVGGTGVFAARALSHSALSSAYGYDKHGKPMPRPRVFAERKILTRKPMRGKGRLGASLALTTMSVPPAVVGLNNLMHGHRSEASKSDSSKRPSLWRDAQHGVKSSLHQRNKTISQHAPISRQAESYGVGTLTGSAAGGLTGLALKKVRLHGGAKAGLIGLAGLTTGVATLPAQSKLMRATSHGKYSVTPTGVARTKTKPARPSTRATRVERRNGTEVPSRLGKSASYPGSNLSHGQKRALVLAGGTTPLVGDFTAAATAGRMAPPNLRKKTAALQATGSLGGSAVGGAAGAYGGAALVRHVPALHAPAAHIKNTVDTVKHGVASRIHPKLGEVVGRRQEAARSGVDTSRITRLAAHRHPALARVGRAAVRARKPLLGVGAVGATLGLAAGQSAGSTIGSSLTYGHALKLEDKQRGKRVAKSKDTRHGTRISKLATAPGMSERERHKAARAKEQSAVLSQVGGGLGLAATGSLLGSKVVHNAKLARHLKAAPVPIMALGGSVGAVNAFKYAAIQHAEAKKLRAPQPVVASKAFPLPRVKSMKGAYLRQTRTAAGIKTATVRGGLT